MSSYDKPCTCGSGKHRYELVDAAGIFCTYVCEDCEEKKKSGYDPRIFRDWYDPDKPDVEYADDH
jgi:hypothetical protein